MGTTSIEWTEKTWNPTRGCSRVSPGCERCYAESIAGRFSRPGQPFDGFAEKRTRTGWHPKWTGKVALLREKLAEPLSWRKPARVFVNSMSDLFHEGLSNEEIAAVFGVMAACPQHTFQVLTKRAERMRAWFEWIDHYDLGDAFTNCHWEALCVERDTIGDDGPIHTKSDAAPGRPWPLPNVWLGVSVEDQRRADERIPHLLATPAAVRFVSAEPLLEAVNLRGHMLSAQRVAECRCGHGHGFTRCPNTGGIATHRCPKCRCTAFARAAAAGGIDWVIVGGESGHGARPFDLAWARSIRDQCKAADVAYFFKQAGAAPVETERDVRFVPLSAQARAAYGEEGKRDLLVKLRLKDKKGGDLAELPIDLHVREFPPTLAAEPAP